MTDLLIRNVPEDVVAAIDAQAGRLGLSRTEYLRRQMVRAATTAGTPVTPASLLELATTLADLADADVMRDAWQ